MIAIPDDSCSVTASLDAALSIVPLTLGLRKKPFDEASHLISSPGNGSFRSVLMFYCRFFISPPRSNSFRSGLILLTDVYFYLFLFFSPGDIRGPSAEQLV